MMGEREIVSVDEKGGKIPCRSVIYIYNHHHLPPWIRSFDLFWHRRVAIVYWGFSDPSSPGFVGEGVFRESGVVQSFEVVDPVLFVFESHVLNSRDL